MKVLIIIPAYNEEKNLPNLLSKLQSDCPHYDIVVINDYSTDDTRKVCRDYHVNTIDLPVNLGIGGAVQAGYKYALYHGYDIAVQVDGDGQHNTEYLELLIKEIEKGNNLCIGSRFINKEGFQSTFIRRIGINYFSKLIHFVSRLIVTDPTSGFRACDKQMIAYFAKEYPRDYPEPETVVLAQKKNFKISEVPVIMNEREGGTSSITSMKSIYYMIKVSLAIFIASLTPSK